MDAFREYYNQTVARIDKAVSATYPEAHQAEPDRFWDYLMANHRQVYDKMKASEREMEQHWLNGNLGEMKKFCLAWGKDYMEMYRLYALHVRREAA